MNYLLRFKEKKQILLEQRLMHVARKSLNALCGHSLPRNFNLTDSLPTHLEPENSEQALSRAQVHHPELRRLLALRRQKELELEREQVSWYPDFSPGVGFEKETDQDGYIVSLAVEIPLWNKNKGGIAKAKAEVRQIEAQLKRVEQDVIRDVETSLEVYASSLEQILAFEELRSAAADALQTETFLYEQGEVDFITLLDARRTAQETESEYLLALYEAQLAQIELEQSIGFIGD